MDTIDTTETTPGLGHNSVDDLPAVDQIIAELEVTHAAALARVAELQEKGSKFFTITNDAEDAAATEFLVPIRSRWKASEADRVAAKDPWETRANSVHAWFKTKILDALGRAPDNPKETFDPVTRTDLGMGPRINMALTLYKRDKVERERKEREALVIAAQKAEAEAKKKRDDEAAAAKAIADKEAADRKAIADKAAADAKALADAAARKRSVEGKAAADKAAAEAKVLADKAAAEQKAADDKAAAEKAEADRLALIEENKLAEATAAAELSASASSADLSRSRGGKAGITSLREYVDVRGIDREKLDYAMIGPYFTDKAVQGALDDYAKANKATVNTGIKTGVQPVRGAVFFINSKNGGRS